MIELEPVTIQLAIALMDRYSQVNGAVAGVLVFVAQSALYLAGKLSEHLDVPMSFDQLDRCTRETGAFTRLMTFYGHQPEQFAWDFPLSTLENSICNMLRNRLITVTPIEVGAAFLVVSASVAGYPT